jgi:hypothetical protein
LRRVMESLGFVVPIGTIEVEGVNTLQVRVAVL